MSTDRSLYENIWKQLKSASRDGLIIKLHFQNAKKPMTTEQKDKYFLRVRKALSHRKELDTEYQDDNPHARLVILNKNYETGDLHIALSQENGSFSLGGLSVEPATAPEPIDFSQM